MINNPFVNKNWTINAKFSILAHEYHVVGSKSNGSVHQTLDTILSIKTGRKLTKSRAEWKKYFDNLCKIENNHS